MNTRRVVLVLLAVPFGVAFLGGILAACIAGAFTAGWSLVVHLVDWLKEPLP